MAPLPPPSRRLRPTGWALPVALLALMALLVLATRAAAAARMDEDGGAAVASLAEAAASAGLRSVPVTDTDAEATAAPGGSFPDDAAAILTGRRLLTSAKVEVEVTVKTPKAEFNRKTTYDG